MRLIAQIPNFITLANLLCGVGAIMASFELAFVPAALFAVAALLLDFLDGTAARVLKVTSNMGKELDSLADVVSFGVAPSLVLFNYWHNEYHEGVFGNSFGSPLFEHYHVALLIGAFAAYRLAKFNITEQSHDHFKGLPTPAFAVACFTLPLAAEQFELANTILNSPWFVIAFVLGGGLLMISNIKLLSLKIGSKDRKLNIIRVLMLVCCAALIVSLKFFGAFLCLLIYLVFSLTAQKQL